MRSRTPRRGNGSTPTRNTIESWRSDGEPACGATHPPRRRCAARPMMSMMLTTMTTVRAVPGASVTTMNAPAEHVAIAARHTTRRIMAAPAASATSPIAATAAVSATARAATGSGAATAPIRAKTVAIRTSVPIVASSARTDDATRISASVVPGNARSVTTNSARNACPPAIRATRICARAAWRGTASTARGAASAAAATGSRRATPAPGRYARIAG
jgi:hypothetical protein